MKLNIESGISEMTFFVSTSANKKRERRINKT
jgi:hypothetical protein